MRASGKNPWAALGFVAGFAAFLHAGMAQSIAPDPSACLAAADEAERVYDLPVGILRAIGIVESGRWQPLLNRVAPWPYAIDAGGYSLFMGSLAEAVARVETLRLDGFQSIDVGCFQINLMFHPAAFASVAEGFDPRANAGYAARFLRTLYGRSGSWADAVADYHSAVPALGEPYRARVYAAWQGAPPGMAVSRLSGAAGGLEMPPAAVRIVSLGSSASIWRPLAIPVFVPMAARVADRRADVSPRRLGTPMGARGGLPRVFTPQQRF